MVMKKNPESYFTHFYREKGSKNKHINSHLQVLKFQDRALGSQDFDNK